jgi:hypothetical protein
MSQPANVYQQTHFVLVQIFCEMNKRAFPLSKNGNEGLNRQGARLSAVKLSKGEPAVKEPGLDNRHRDENGQIEQKRGNTLNQNLPRPIPQFSPRARLDTMRKET